MSTLPNFQHVYIRIEVHQTPQKGLTRTGNTQTKDFAFASIARQRQPSQQHRRISGLGNEALGRWRACSPEVFGVLPCGAWSSGRKLPRSLGPRVQAPRTRRHTQARCVRRTKRACARLVFRTHGRLTGAALWFDSVFSNRVFAECVGGICVVGPRWGCLRGIVDLYSYSLVA